MAEALLTTVELVVFKDSIWRSKKGCDFRIACFAGSRVLNDVNMQEPTESGYYWYRPGWAGWEMVKVACIKGCGDKLYCFIINTNYTILCESIKYMSANGIWCTKIEPPQGDECQNANK